MNSVEKRSKNLWILTEERPKKKVLEYILGYFAKDNGFGFLGGELKILPILNEDNCFDFTYKLTGFECSKVSCVYIKTISGNSSFVDYLIYYQDEQPQPCDIPLYAIEETKTDDSESRNTGVFQRCSKFVFLRHYYPLTKAIMLYSLQIEQKERPTQTYIFGTRLLLTLGVEILGKKLDNNIFKPFSSVEEIVSFKQGMKNPPKGNVAISITKTEREVSISGRLCKNNSIGHDPNIGALSLIAATIRKLGWKGRIIITNHGLQQSNIKKGNKFLYLAEALNLDLENLSLPRVNFPADYWHYDTKSEKLATIFLHVIVENFTESYSIFDNHAGCEKSYFQTSDGKRIPLKKYSNRDAYKAGDKSQIVSIPDLVLVDINTKQTILTEGKKYQNLKKGIKELENYDSFIESYLLEYYPDFEVVKTLALFGGKEEKIIEVEVGFLLNEKGKLVLGIYAPQLFRRAVQNVIDFWS